MPVLKIQTNVETESNIKEAFLDIASATVSRILHKPETYVMVILEYNSDMRFAGDDSPLAYLELKSIGLPSDHTRELSQALCQLITTHLAIQPNRIYIEFANAEHHMWGWNSSTF